MNILRIFTKWLMVPLLIACFAWIGQGYLAQLLGPTLGQWTAFACTVLFGIAALWIWFNTTKKKARE